MDPSKKIDSANSSKSTTSDSTWKQFTTSLKKSFGQLKQGDNMDRFEEDRKGFIQKETGQKQRAVQGMIDTAAKKAKNSFCPQRAAGPVGQEPTGRGVQETSVSSGAFPVYSSLALPIGHSACLMYSASR